MSKGKTQKKTGESAAPATPAADRQAPKRKTRLPIDAIKSAFAGVERSIADAALFVSQKVGENVSERDVRLGIDQLRRKGEPVVRTKLKHFRLGA